MLKWIHLISRLLLISVVVGLVSCGKTESTKSKEELQVDGVIPEVPVSETDLVGEADPLANPNAVPGGTYTTWGGGFPESLNYWLDPNSTNGQIMGLLFDSLVSLHTERNEPVGGLADHWEISKDGKEFTFHIDPRAVWSDGKPVTARDFQFYYEVMMNPKHLTPVFRVSLSRFERPEVLDEHTLKVRAKSVHWNNFWDAAGLTAFPAHLWENKDFNQINFEFPVVNGPYEIQELKKERSITLKRRSHWWGRYRRYNQHKFNFDQIKYRFMEDRNKALEAFKKGDFDLYPVYTASIWAQQTEFDQVKKGWVARQRVFNKEPIGMQGFAINLRREMFQDVRVREALCHLLNRELMQEKLMFNQYFLLNSYFPDLYSGNQNPHVPLRGYDPDRARKLLDEAGWKVGDTGVLEKGGKRFEITIPTQSPDLRHYNIYVEDMKKVGIVAKIDQLSQSTYSKRIDQFDFDLAWMNWGAGRLRDPEPQWLSTEADRHSSYNLPGLKDPQIDALIEKQKTEMNLDKRNEILKKMDLRLNEQIPYILLWQSDNSRLLYWRKFGTPTYILDKFNREDAAIAYWWLDPEKERKLNEAMKSGSSLPPVESDVHYPE